MVKINKYKDFIKSLFFSIIVFFFSYYFNSLYINGDPEHYTKFYYGIKGVGIQESYILYGNYLGAREPFYFFIIYIVKDFIERNEFQSFVNSLLAFYLSRLLLKNKISYLFILSIITNFYFLVLILAAERLKFSFFFFLLYMYKEGKLRYSFLVFSLLSHTQTLLLFVSEYSVKIVSLLKDVFLKNRVNKLIYILLLSVFSLFIVFILSKNIESKVEAYSSNSILNVIKPSIFFVLTYILYKKNFINLFFMNLPLIIVAYFVGDERITMLSYFLFMYMSFKRSKNLNIYILLTSVYFAYKGYDFINNIILYGNGFKFE